MILAPCLEIENPIHVPFVWIPGCVEIGNLRASPIAATLEHCVGIVAILDYCVVTENRMASLVAEILVYCIEIKNRKGDSFVVIPDYTEIVNRKVSFVVNLDCIASWIGEYLPLVFVQLESNLPRFPTSTSTYDVLFPLYPRYQR